MVRSSFKAIIAILQPYLGKIVGMSVEISIQLMPGAVLPAYQTPGSAGMDLVTTQSCELQPGERCALPTGIRIALPEGYEAQVRPRSGLAAKFGIGMVNTPGTIDSDYRGEIRVLLINHGQKSVKLEAGERVAQLVIAPVVRASWSISESLDETERGVGGFGSTGK
jgi:dUTP pyrophosphatase